MRDLQEFWVTLPPTEWNGRHGASLETLADRLRYGGRKGRRAGQRILRREYPHQAVAQNPKPLRPADHDATETRGVKDR